MKIISTRQLAFLKRNAQNVYPLVAKRDKLTSQIHQLNEALNSVLEQIEATETGSRLITDGINSIDLIQRVVVDTGKVDKSGNPVKATKYEPIEGRLVLQDDGTYLIADVPNNEGPKESETII